jgi:hypothetical protein
VRISIILGAGSSLANAEHFRPRRGRATHPPLDYTFFEKIAERDMVVPRDLLAYAEELPTGSPFSSPAGGSRMEEFLRDLFHDFLQERATANSRPVRAYRRLVEIYARVLRETTNWMLPSTYAGGPVGRLIAGAAEVAERVDIITFNHDLVIENEIAKRARLAARWCIERSYGSFSEGRTLLVAQGIARFPAHSDECDHEHPIVIHKLHGSLNWYLRIRAKEPTPGVLAGEVTSPDVMVSLESALREIRSVRMRPTGRGRQSWYVWPVIVPPVYAKQSLIESFMPSVWRDANEALAESDRVLFFGYSMPQADIEAEKMFQRTIRGNASLPWVGVINPAPEVMMRYTSLLPKTPIRRFHNADSFLAGSAFG